VSIERCTLVVWGIPPERLAERIPAALRLETCEADGQKPRALLALLAGRIRLSPFGLALPAFTQVSYQVYVRNGPARGIYVLRSLIHSRPLAVTSRGAFGFPAQGGRLSLRWEPSGRAEIRSPEAQLSFTRERAPFAEPFLGATHLLLCPSAAYWTRRGEDLGALDLTSTTPDPLSGTIEAAKLPWLEEQQLLSEDEARQPLAVYFANPHRMNASLADQRESKRRLVVVPSS
jgi:hypothetical protein